MLTFICCPKDSNCQEAQAFLDSLNAPYNIRDIETEAPTYDELKKWLVLSDLPVTSFFNTSGSSYMSMGLKDKLPTMSEDECLHLLAADSMLLSYPLLANDDGVLVGYNHDKWEFALSDLISVSNTITVEMTDSNDIHFPFEWHTHRKIGHGYAQITLVDDKIAIHKPLATDKVYTKPCKAGDNSYIRSFDMFGTRVPKQFFEALGIKSGDKIDLSLEENCISIRKNTDVAPEVLASEPPEPIMAFCCVCGDLRYTDNTLVKVSAKYICHDCIEIVKAL